LSARDHLDERSEVGPTASQGKPLLVGLTHRREVSGFGGEGVDEENGNKQWN